MISGRTETNAVRLMKNKPTKDSGVNLSFHPDRCYHWPLDKYKTTPDENPQKHFIETSINAFPASEDGFIQGPMTLYVQLRQILINWILSSPVATTVFHISILFSILFSVCYKTMFRKYQHCCHEKKIYTCNNFLNKCTAELGHLLYANINILSLF